MYVCNVHLPDTFSLWNSCRSFTIFDVPTSRYRPSGGAKILCFVKSPIFIRRKFLACCKKQVEPKSNASETYVGGFKKSGALLSCSRKGWFWFIELTTVNRTNRFPTALLIGNIRFGNKGIWWLCNAVTVLTVVSGSGDCDSQIVDGSLRTTLIIALTM